jgi:glutathionylspermidine synthase
LHIASVHHDFDCAGTAAYVGDCAAHAGIETCLIDVAEIGLAGDRLVDLEERPITHMFKLYPWEWLASEDPAFFAALNAHEVGVLEPAWRAAAASKGILVDLWAAAPECPYLLPAFWEESALASERVGKPAFGRQGANVTLRSRDGTSTQPGPYGAQPVVWQARTPLGDFDGRKPVFGVWVVGGDVCGLGIREDTADITGPRANFIPHRIV